ncbi:hypothetical protein BDZ85DRAFT_49137 [Elsinoe ampelina]|uniref:Uncharacterized protein n=1 Tax=Elsinoe ampelina TaxID=302913 RepID=A0A6A6GKZ9_9PEZI|nr:hypothetical protein BDZ85DRAFT_49137 [Elsinoe ampelina]
MRGSFLMLSCGRKMGVTGGLLGGWLYNLVAAFGHLHLTNPKHQLLLVVNPRNRISDTAPERIFL